MIRQNQQTLQSLIVKAEDYLKTLSYSNNRMRVFRQGWHELDEYMKEHSITYYDPLVGEGFIKKILDTSSYSELSKVQKDIIRSANVLTEYQTTGTVRFRSILKKYEFQGKVGEIILKFLAYRKSIGLTKDTLDSNKLYLHRFFEYLEINGVNAVSKLRKIYILDFVNSLGFYSKSTIHCTLSTIRNFLKYLKDNKYTDIDLSYLVPKSSYKKEAKLPTTYKKDEIERLILAVDRGNPKGKRDVAIILLASRLGLRASDICGLKFENIHWETNTIFLLQQKTKKKLNYPC